MASLSSVISLSFTSSSLEVFTMSWRLLPSLSSCIWICLISSNSSITPLTASCAASTADAALCTCWYRLCAHVHLLGGGLPANSHSRTSASKAFARPPEMCDRSSLAFSFIFRYLWTRCPSAAKSPSSALISNTSSVDSACPTLSLESLPSLLLIRSTSSSSSAPSISLALAPPPCCCLARRAAILSGSSPSPGILQASSSSSPLSSVCKSLNRSPLRAPTAPLELLFASTLVFNISCSSVLSARDSVTVKVFLAPRSVARSSSSAATEPADPASKRLISLHLSPTNVCFILFVSLIDTSLSPGRTRPVSAAGPPGTSVCTQRTVR
mmetsp:Transcript_34672/g.84414  ORF Transcript_34672/g.84414 Transcript_34672/m.84414 type:complete len:326 (-) Transcript_34672:168-1145(-)